MNRLLLALVRTRMARVYEHNGSVYIFRDPPSSASTTNQYAVRENRRMQWMPCRDGAEFSEVQPYATIARWRSDSRAFEKRQTKKAEARQARIEARLKAARLLRRKRIVEANKVARAMTKIWNNYQSGLAA